MSARCETAAVITHELFKIIQDDIYCALAMCPYIYLRLAVGKSLAWGLITFDCPWRVHWPHLNLNHRLLESLHLLEGGGLQPEYLRNKKNAM